jgi:hypothetical protein
MTHGWAPALHPPPAMLEEEGFLQATLGKLDGCSGQSDAGKCCGWFGGGPRPRGHIGYSS